MLFTKRISQKGNLINDYQKRGLKINVGLKDILDILILDYIRELFFGR